MSPKKFILIVFLAFILDIASKYIVKALLVDAFGEINIISGFFKMIYVKNYGLLFGFFENLPHLMKIAMMLAGITILVVYIFLNFSKFKKLELYGMSLILGGGLGNIIDRIINGAVFDFLHFYLGRRSFPTFNIADVLIDIGIVLFIIAQFKREKNAPGTV